MSLVVMVPAAFGTPAGGNFNISVAGTAVGSIPHQIDLKVTQLPGGQLTEVSGFAVKRRKLRDINNEFRRILPYLLGFIFDKLADVLNRIGEVDLQELPRMADFAEMGELVARCLGYSPMRFTEAYNRNRGFSNEEAVDSNLVANVIVNMMETQAAWTGKIGMLRIKLNEFISQMAYLRGIVQTKEWPKTDHALRDRLNEVIPNLLEMGIVVDKQEDKHTKTYTYTIANNHFQSEVDGYTGGSPDQI